MKNQSIGLPLNFVKARCIFKVAGNEKVSDKYILYFHKAMKEYAQQEREKAVSELLELIQNTKIV